MKKVLDANAILVQSLEQEVSYVTEAVKSPPYLVVRVANAIVLNGFVGPSPRGAGPWLARAQFAHNWVAGHRRPIDQ